MISLTTATAGTPVTVPCLTPPAGCEGIDHDLYLVHPAYHKSHLPLPPLPWRPDARLGQIYWPCWGMTRFAFGHVLVSAAAYSSMIAGGGDWSTGFGRDVFVTLTDDRNSPITLPMQVKSARPFADPRAVASAVVDGTIKQAWILTLADFRYTSGYIGVGTASTWGDLIYDLLNSLADLSQTASGINSILGEFSPAYINPPLAELWQNTDFTQIKVEAALAAVNLRTVPVTRDNYYNDYHVQGPLEASSAWSSWLAAYGQYMAIPVNSSRGAGGLIDGGAENPLGIYLDFHGSAGVDQISKSFTGSTIEDYLSAQLNFISNSTDRGNHAQRYADDAARWLALGQIDATFSGFVPVPLSSIPYGVIYRDDAKCAETRIVRSPHLHPWPLSRSLFGGWTGTFATGDSRTVSVSDGIIVGVA